MSDVAEPCPVPVAVATRFCCVAGGSTPFPEGSELMHTSLTTGSALPGRPRPES